MKIRNVFWHNCIPDSHNYNDTADPTVSLFREQIKFILANYTPISIHDFIGIVSDNRQARSFSKPPILLGFDDGFKNVLTYALPVLGEFNIPALFFILGGTFLDPNFVPWYVEVKHLLRRTRRKSIVFNGRRIELGSSQEHKIFRTFFKRRFKACRRDEERQRLMSQLAESVNVIRPVARELDEDLRFVGHDDLAELNSSTLISVGSHAMTHRNLENLSYGEQRYELENSHTLLHNLCRSYCHVISYPDGSFNPDTLSIAKTIYKFGFAVFRGSFYKNCFAYPRYCVEGSTLDQLKYTLSPVRMNCVLPIKKLLLNTFS